MKKRKATISGQALLATINTMSSLGDMGTKILLDYGIKEIDSKKRYSYTIRRDIHEMAFRRFGENALYAFGLNDYWAYSGHGQSSRERKEKVKGISDIRNAKQASIGLKEFILQTCDNYDSGFKSGIKNGLGKYGVKVKELGKDRYCLFITNTSTLRHSAYVRGAFDIAWLSTLSDCWDFSSSIDMDLSEEGEDWAKFAYILNFQLLKESRNLGDFLHRATKAVDEKLIKDILDESEAQKKKIESISQQIGKYIPPQIHQSLLKGRYDTKIATRRKKLTIFFSDIVNFTSTSEGLQPEDLTKYLNEYFSEMTTIAIDCGATIDKYIGDAMMVFFGDPESSGEKEDARACVEMGLRMQERLVELQEKWGNEGFADPFQVRMGINTGYCNVGNFGSDQRLTYTIIGGEVNVAQRLEAGADANGILMTYETYAHVQDMIEVEERDAIKMKGISREIKVFSVSERKTISESKKLDVKKESTKRELSEIEKIKKNLALVKNNVEDLNKKMDAVLKKI